ncbi:MAG: nucleotidyltransferase domain-containing protein [Sulfuricurvum sp.]
MVLELSDSTMRLSSNYQNTIKKYFNQFFQNGEIYLFGSRVDDNKKGGDIDLYLVLKEHTNLFDKKIKFLSRIKRELGEQKIDVIFNTDSSRLIEKEAIQWGIKL